ncbi:hypothetical protein HYW74_00070 [Candidatus Pacearchaeota archaeon]|nr:hypothetical protein [Candidatus Pacearchaeota archaeon]
MTFKKYRKEEINFNRYEEVFFKPDLTVNVKRRHVKDNAKDNKSPVVLILDSKIGAYVEGVLEFDKDTPEEYLLTDKDSPGSEETLRLRYGDLTSLLIKKPHVR